MRIKVEMNLREFESIESLIDGVVSGFNDIGENQEKIKDFITCFLTPYEFESLEEILKTMKRTTLNIEIS